MFENVPSDRKTCNLIHCSKKERREGDKDTKGLGERNTLKT
jgi:hypothetical protein